MSQCMHRSVNALQYFPHWCTCWLQVTPNLYGNLVMNGESQHGALLLTVSRKQSHPERDVAVQCCRLRPSAWDESLYTIT